MESKEYCQNCKHYKDAEGADDNFAECLHPNVMGKLYHCEYKENIIEHNEHTQKLLGLIKENPTLPIVPMVNSECTSYEDWQYYLCSFSSCRVDKYIVYNERVYFEEDKSEFCESYYYDNEHNLKTWKKKKWTK